MPSITKIKNVRYLFIASFLFISVYLSGQNTIVYSIDLNKLTNDKLSVQVKTPKFKEDQIDFFFPKIVPGTYANYDFGRYISDFQAYDAQGKSLSFVKKNVNQYQIKNAGKLTRITYQVDDTWDSPEIDGEYVFEPAGTSFLRYRGIHVQGCIPEIAYNTGIADYANKHITKRASKTWIYYNELPVNQIMIAAKVCQ